MLTKNRMGDSIFNNNRNKAFVLLLAAVVTLTAALFTVWMDLNKARSREKVLAAENTELHSALEKENGHRAQPEPVMKLDTENREQREFAYVPKENEPTDVEVNSSKNIHIKINGKTAEIKPEIQEETKFQNGKLVVTEASEMKIRIDAPVKTKWTGTYLYSPKEKKHGIGIGYAIGREVTLNAMYIADRAYFGVTFPIGSFSSKK